MKLKLLLILGLCAFQEFETRSLKKIYKTGDILDDIMAMIKTYDAFINDMMEKQHIVGDDYDYLAVFLQDYDDAIQSIVINFVNDIKAKIKNISNSSEKGKECVEEHQTDIDKWLNNINVNLKSCADNTSEILINIEVAYDAWLNNATLFLDDVHPVISSCTQKNVDEDILTCFEDQFPALANRFSDLHQSAVSIIDTINNPLIADGFQQCIKSAINNIKDQATQIINTINDCVAN